MQINFFKIGIITLLLSLASCAKQNSEHSDDVAIKINLDSLTCVSDNGEFSRYFDAIEFCSLEQTSDCLLGRIKKVVETDSIIYVMDKTQEADNPFGGEKRLYAFDKNGKFKYQVSRKGGGPGEYRYMDAFCVASDTVYILDRSNRFLCFDSSGRYVKTSKKMEPGEGVYHISIYDIQPFGSDGGFVASANYSSYNTAVVDCIYYPFSGKTLVPLLENPFDTDDFFVSYSGNEPMLTDSFGNMVMTRAYSPFIYKINSETLSMEKFAEIECGVEIPEPMYKENFNEFTGKIDNVLRLTHFPLYAYQVGKWLIVSFFTGSVLYDTVTGEGVFTSNPVSNKDSKEFPFNLPYVVGLGQDNSVISWMSGESVSSIREKNPGLFTDDAFKGITEESNPVLIRYKFKEVE